MGIRQLCNSDSFLMFTLLFTQETVAWKTIALAWVKLFENVRTKIQSMLCAILDAPETAQISFHCLRHAVQRGN